MFAVWIFSFIESNGHQPNTYEGVFLVYRELALKISSSQVQQSFF